MRHVILQINKKKEFNNTYQSLFEIEAGTMRYLRRVILLNSLVTGWFLIRWTLPYTNQKENKQDVTELEPEIITKMILHTAASKYYPVKLHTV
jgi:hypothetical protein